MPVVIDNLSITYILLLAGWLVGWLAGWLVGWLAGWLENFKYIIPKKFNCVPFSWNWSHCLQTSHFNWQSEQQIEISLG